MDPIKIITNRSCSAGIQANQISLNRVERCRGAGEFNALIIAADQIPGTCHCATDTGVACTILNQHAVVRVASIQGSGCVSADAVALNQRARRSGIADNNPVGVSGDRIAFGRIAVAIKVCSDQRPCRSTFDINARIGIPNHR